ncbi:MAG: DUF3299 domain-containing protein [Phycisphaerales bacterium]|jgi:hypothetical protein
MKTFWMLMAILVVAGCSYLAWSAMSQSRDRAEQARVKAIEAMNAMEASRASEVAPAPAVIATKEATEITSTPPTTPTAPVSPPPEPADAKSSVETAPAESPAPKSADIVQSPAPQGTVGAKPGVYDVAPNTLENQPDGSILVDGKFKITGDGSVERPFDVPWDLLIGSEKTYNPTEKLTRIPQAVAMLDGKYVRLTGYVAFPMYVQEPRELLSMLNQWDGCCIGVPPTPYDAVEVTLKQTVNEDDRMATFGAVEGRFGVKPYVVGDWLVGLYIMDEGVLHAKQFGGAGS